MPKVRVHNLAMSLDGYAAGPDQSLDHPLGVGGERLFDHLDGGPHGYECTELVSSPSVAHTRISRATK